MEVVHDARIDSGGGSDPTAELADEGGGHLGVPVVVGDGEVDGAAFGGEDGLGEGAGDVAGGQRLERLVDEGFGELRGADIGEHDFGTHHVSDLLARGDDELGTGDDGVRQGAEAVSRAGGGVEVDEGGTVGDLRVAIGHGDDRGFVEAEDVAGVEVLEEGQFVRAGVAEEYVHAVEGHELMDDVAHAHACSGAGFAPGYWFGIDLGLARHILCSFAVHGGADGKSGGVVGSRVPLVDTLVTPTTLGHHVFIH